MRPLLAAMSCVAQIPCGEAATAAEAWGPSGGGGLSGEGPGSRTVAWVIECWWKFRGSGEVRLAHLCVYNLMLLIINPVISK